MASQYSSNISSKKICLPVISVYAAISSFMTAIRSKRVHWNACRLSCTRYSGKHLNSLTLRWLDMTVIGRNLAHQFEELWEILMACANGFDGEIICVIDGLDECGARKRAPDMIQTTFTERGRLAEKLASLASNDSDVAGACFKLLLSARTGSGDEWNPFMRVGQNFIDITADADLTNKDIEHFIDIKVNGLEIKQADKPKLKQQLWKFQTESSTYLWLDLIFKLLSTPPYRGKSVDDLAYLSTSVEDAFEKLLAEDKYSSEAKVIFHLVLSARRPLTLSELSEAFEFATKDETSKIDPQDDKNCAETLSLYYGSFVDIATVRDESAYRNWKSGEIYFESRQTVNFFHQEARRFLIQASVSQSQTTFRHAFKIDDSADIMRRRCVRYLRYYGSKNMEVNLGVQYTHEAVVQWLLTYLKAHPLMEYAALH